MVLLGALLFVALNAWMALRSVKWLAKSQKWVDHTWEVIAQVERLVSSAKDAETGSRGYLLTGQERFLEPYVAARKALPAELAGFMAVTADNASQQVRAA
jgi:CHASE3 domain sensor protein